MNIKDVDLNNPEHFKEIPDVMLVIKMNGTREIAKEDVEKMLMWIARKHLDDR